MKNHRHNAILTMVSGNGVRTQGDILKELRRQGFAATQATVSRDLRELCLTKVPSPDGGYFYAAADKNNAASPPARLSAVLREAVNACESAQNLVVVKTMPGLAPAACSAIDAMDAPGVIGTLAGDDTGLAVCIDNQAAEALRDKIRGFIQR